MVLVSHFDRVQTAVAGTLAEIRDARGKATQELVALMAGDKVMGARADELAAEAANWQARAETALRAGDEALAREALVQRRWTIAELAQVRADRDQQTMMVRELLRSRRELDAKLAQFELRQGSIAREIAAGQGGSPLAAEGDAWDRFADAERRIEEQAIVDELAEGEIDPADLAHQKVDRLEKQLGADAALDELKRKVRGS